MIVDDVTDRLMGSNFSFTSTECWGSFVYYSNECWGSFVYYYQLVKEPKLYIKCDQNSLVQWKLLL